MMLFVYMFVEIFCVKQAMRIIESNLKHQCEEKYAGDGVGKAGDISNIAFKAEKF